MKEFSVPLKLWNELVPFSLYFKKSGELAWASDRILEIWNTSLDHIRKHPEALVMLRPFRDNLRAELLPELTDIVLHLVHEAVMDNIIRGQLYPYEDGWVFTGCPLVSSVEDIEKMGMDLHRFPLHMGTGEMLLANETTQSAYRDVLDQAEKLRDSEERFRLISEQSLVGIVILQDGMLKYANDQWARICETTVEEMYGWGPNGFIVQVHPDDRELLIEQARKKQAGETDILEQYEWRLITPSGKTKWISIYSRTVPYFGKNADLCTLIDVTEQKNAEWSLRESEQRLRAVFDSAQDAIFIKDVEGRYTQVNPAMENLLGLSSDEIVGKTEFDLMDSESAERLRRADEQVLAGATIDEENSIRIDGVKRYFHNLKVPLTNPVGEVVGLCGVSRDITIRKNAMLAKEKHLRSEAANKAKTEFLARVSHELRTPLNAIIGYSEMLLENSREEGAEHYSKDLGKILDASGHLLELINDILDMSKVETGKMELYVEEVSLDEIIAEVSSIMTPLMKTNENQFEIIREFSSDLQILIDRTKLRQVLLNLLSNASKFTRSGKVVLRVELLKEASPEAIRFSVKDDGIGIEKSNLTRIFRRFTQAEEDTAFKYGGTGLGLPITKAFLKMMGGTIEVSSEIGKGSLFEVTLPVDLAKANQKS